MMTDQNLSARISCSLPIALVALAIAFGPSVVRAQSETWRDTTIDPIMNALHAAAERLASIEASVALFADSFTTHQLNTRQLCVSDETGAQTCITKAQLDAILAKIAQTAAVEVPAVTAKAPEPVVEAPRAVIEATPIVTKAQVSPIGEPAPVDSDWTYGSAWLRDAKPSNSVVPAADPAAVAAAVVIELSQSSDQDSALGNPSAEKTTIVIAPEPVAARTGEQDATLRDQKPVNTGSVPAEPSRDALD
jgi:hypothetical protein